MNAELPSDVTPKIQPSELTSEVHTHTQCLDIGKTGNVSYCLESCGILKKNDRVCFTVFFFSVAYILPFLSCISNQAKNKDGCLSH